LGLARKKILPADHWPDLATTSCVFTKGSFDLLHSGHLALIAFCADRARDVEPAAPLVVAVESDASVRRRKGAARPFQSQQERALQLAMLPTVDWVVVVDSKALSEAVRAIRPSVYVKGMDTAGVAGEGVEGAAVLLDPSTNGELGSLSASSRIIVFTDDGSISTTELARRVAKQQA